MVDRRGREIPIMRLHLRERELQGHCGSEAHEHQRERTKQNGRQPPVRGEGENPKPFSPYLLRVIALVVCAQLRLRRQDW